MVEVIWHAGESAGLPPLEGRRNCQNHLRDFMDGEIPSGDRAARTAKAPGAFAVRSEWGSVAADGSPAWPSL